MKLHDDVIDFLQTISAIWKMESGNHPTIKKGDERYEKFIKWAREKYHDEINNLIKKN